jgi:AbiV family abortive infection protein
MTPVSSTLLKAPSTKDVQASIEACLANADQMMEDAQALEFRDPAGTRLALSMLAQEEYSKAFILYMVREGLVPWDTDLLRVIRVHACKHLVAIVMEYIDPQWETLEELQGILNAEYDLDGRFPAHVSSALNILYHEKIRRGDFLDDEDYERDVEGIARGERDKFKQAALYVDVDKSCRVRSSPLGIKLEESQAEYDRAQRYRSTVQSLLRADAYEGPQLQKLKEAMKIVFWQKYTPSVSAGE